MIADTSCSPNVSTEEPASVLKNPASRLEKPTSLVASFLPAARHPSGSLCCCLLARHLSLTAASLKGERCAQPDPKMSPPAIHPAQISTFSLPDCPLSSKVPRPSPISLSSPEPSLLEKQAARGPLPWNRNNYTASCKWMGNGRSGLF